MPRYYFDVRDHDGIHFDEVGSIHPEISAARIEARRALGEMMQENIAVSGKAVIAIDIRTSEGKSIVEVVAASDDRDLSAPCE